MKQALRDMIKLIGELSGLSPQNAYTLCSIAADLRVTQTATTATKASIACWPRPSCRRGASVADLTFLSALPRVV